MEGDDGGDIDCPLNCMDLISETIAAMNTLLPVQQYLHGVMLALTIH